jgi:UDP-glucose 4-epimerase
VTDTDSDYETRDGTMIRDYIHVLDLAQGHIAALKHLQAANPGVRAWNFGSGRGETVIETLKAFGRAVGREIPSGVEPRRPEYVPDLTASTERAATELKWTADKTLEEACADFWFWNTNNPEGYAQAPPEYLLKAMKF